MLLPEWRKHGRWPHVFLVKDSCMEISMGSYDLDFKSPSAPAGYRWVAAARKKDIEWDAMRDWKKACDSEQYMKLRDAFSAGKAPEEYGVSTLQKNGISNSLGMLYQDGETLEEYLERHGLTDPYLYPDIAFAYLSEDGWESRDSFTHSTVIGDKRLHAWRTALDMFINGQVEDAVLVSVDCHI